MCRRKLLLSLVRSALRPEIHLWLLQHVTLDCAYTGDGSLPTVHASDMRQPSPAFLQANMTCGAVSLLLAKGVQSLDELKAKVSIFIQAGCPVSTQAFADCPSVYTRQGSRIAQAVYLPGATWLQPIDRCVSRLVASASVLSDPWQSPLTMLSPSVKVPGVCMSITCVSSHDGCLKALIRRCPCHMCAHSEYSTCSLG